VFIDDVLCTIMRQSFGIDMVPAFKGSGSSGLGRGFCKKKKKKKPQVVVDTPTRPFPKSTKKPRNSSAGVN